MRFEVLSQVVASAESFRTSVASEWTLLGMGSDVPFQMLEPFENASTRYHWARETFARRIRHGKGSDRFFRSVEHLRRRDWLNA